ncbi:NAD-dependent succinate-semialdehyde dehydrogenase [Streptomyces sp. 11-1-2]|uniref:NAD-dependent succinate-semialdehyde dehydrogenase n=1 Tax=Streptomyces sp. 11-1-2 TaxID=1851167 RepID=UPI000B8D48B8|nr:NAD-dependent succinate-semialdehyde dehydrogenase [Streptomyces sp. 11-1-2]ASQ91897.1 NADP-dependent succinic semialdehyde dehydrogenase [Streptomyces sp. 11-1-2]
MAVRQINSVNPATGDVVARFDPHSPAGIDAALEHASVAAGQWRSMPVPARAGHLKRAAALLRAERDRLAALITEEMGKPIAEAEAEIDKSAWCCEYYATQGPEQLLHQPVATGAARSHIAFDPLGLVLAVMPWNYPLWQVFRFAPPALLSGNGIVLKHASNVPRCALAIADIWNRAGCPAGLFTTLLVGPDAVPDLIADPRIHALTLTGSTEVGSTVAAMAARHLKPQVLELGGSDPFIVLADADIPAAAAAAVSARMLNTGQSCISAKRFIVEEAVAEEFTDAFAAGVAALTVGDPFRRDVRIGPLARSSLRDDLVDQVQRSTAAGARIVTGGTVLDGPGYFYVPAVLDQVTPTMAVAAEETFGPVAAVVSAKDCTQAVEIANTTEFGLGAALWTTDLERADRLIPGIEAGAVFVNGIVASDPRLPFGGIKRSGYGRELGVFGLRQFTNVKSVWIGPARNEQPYPLSE